MTAPRKVGSLAHRLQGVRPRRLTFTVLLLASALLLGAVPGRYSAKDVPKGEVPALGSLAFLTGTWETDGGKGKGPTTEEIWSSARAGTLIGVNRVMKDDRTVFWEHLRVETRDGDGLYYVANPLGKGEVAFRLVQLGANYAVFENKTHDWPTTITYGLTDIDGQLCAVASGTDGGVVRSESWMFMARAP